MKARLLGFIDALRQAGIETTVAESLDAARAAAAAGVERAILREALAATLVKDHGDRPTFNVAFDRYFGVRGARKTTRQPQPTDGEGSGGEGQGQGRAARRDGQRGGDDARAEHERGTVERESRAAERLAARRALLTRPFRDLDPRHIEEMRELVADLGQRFRSRWSRRARRANRGRLDMRRTIRRAMSRGGVPIELLYRTPRPGKSNLVALVDLSYSTATAASFLLALLAPARRFFRRITWFAYVDALAEISYEGGHVVPHQSLDTQARSDFGRVLTQLAARDTLRLDRNTVLLILGDARNNRRPPRADLLRAFHQRVRAVIWLNPDAPEGWNSGDSVMASYARHCDSVLAAHNLRTLLRALSELGKHT